jgi:hypothetical protein
MEPRRATVSCKNLFKSIPDGCSIPTNSSSYRRQTQNSVNFNSKRTPHYQNTYSRSNTHIVKQQQQQYQQRSKANYSHANVFHIPFVIEPVDADRNVKSLSTRLNPLSPAFHSKRQPLVSLESKVPIIESR